MKLLNSLALLIIGMAVITSCKKEDNPELDNPVTKMAGKVILYDNYYGPILEGRAGTQVQLTGEFQGFDATTDITGRYEFSGIPDGNYSITLSRDGFASMQINGIQFSQGSPNLTVQGEYQMVPSVTMGRISESYFDSTEVKVVYNTEFLGIDSTVIPPEDIIDTTSAELRFSTTVLPYTPVPDAKYGYRLFIGKSSNNSKITNYMATQYGTVPAATGELELVWTQSEWQNLGFTFEDNVFIRIYGDAVIPITYEVTGGQTVFPALSDSLGVDFDTFVPFN